MSRPYKIIFIHLILLVFLIASSQAFSAETPKKDEEKKQTEEDQTDATTKDESPVSLAEEPAIEEHAFYLKREKANIERERQALIILRTEVKKEIQKMEVLRRELDVKLADLDEQRKTRIGKLVKVYQGIPSQDVVLLLDNLDEDIMLDVLFRMKSKKQSQILALMEPEKAARISKKLIEKNGN